MKTVHFFVCSDATATAAVGLTGHFLIFEDVRDEGSS